MVAACVHPIPRLLQADVDRAVQILREFGCTEVYMFGSLAGDGATEQSDIDLAVRGCPDEDFFRVYGRLLTTLSRPVDLVGLDDDDRFSQHLREGGALVRIG